MKLAILLLCHKNAKQINLLLDTLKHPDIDFYVHMDKKANIVNQITKRPDIHFLPDDLRVDVKWGGFSMIEATRNLLETAYKGKRYDYFWLCSGQDFPLVSSQKIIKYFQNHIGLNFISYWPSFHFHNANRENHYDKRNAIFFPQFLMDRSLIKRILKRIYIEISGGWNYTISVFRRKDKFSIVPFYYGPSWWALTNEFIQWSLHYIKVNPWYSEGYKNALNPDESFFQTLLMLSPFKQKRQDYLHYIDWSPRTGKRRNSPNTLTISDFEKMKESGYLMARKFDMDVDQDIINKLHDTINGF